MKRFISLLLALTLGIMIFSTCVAEEVVIEPSEEATIYVVRPHIKYVFDNGEFTRLTFGEKVTVNELQGEYAFIETEDGQSGKVTVGFLAPSYYPILWFDEVGCYMSPTPGLTSSDYAYGACGMRYEERVIILMEEDDYWFVVTEEGYSGYVYKFDPHIQLYVDQVPSES